MELIIPGRAAPVTVKDCVGSTNTCLKEMAMNGTAEGSVLVALKQSGGRGRQDRSFVSPGGWPVSFHAAHAPMHASGKSLPDALYRCGRTQGDR